jgi:hypothetical protein
MKNCYFQAGQSVMFVFPMKICGSRTLLLKFAREVHSSSLIRRTQEIGLAGGLLHAFIVYPGRSETNGTGPPNAAAPPPPPAPTATRARIPPPPVSRGMRRLAAPMAGPPRLAPGAAQRPPHVGPRRSLRLRRRRGGRDPARS